MDAVRRLCDVIIHDHSLIIRKILLLSLQEPMGNDEQFTSCFGVLARKHIDYVFHSFPLPSAGHERGVPYNNSNLKHRSRYKTIMVLTGCEFSGVHTLPLLAVWQAKSGGCGGV